jgi:hypothetical protein
VPHLDAFGMAVRKDASFLLYQKGRDSRIFQAQDRAIDDFSRLLVTPKLP